MLYFQTSLPFLHPAELITPLVHDPTAVLVWMGSYRSQETVHWLYTDSWTMWLEMSFEHNFPNLPCLCYSPCVIDQSFVHRYSLSCFFFSPFFWKYYILIKSWRFGIKIQELKFWPQNSSVAWLWENYLTFCSSVSSSVKWKHKDLKGLDEIIQKLITDIA